jgi:hypothetical protein
MFIITERRGRGVNTPASYFESLGFKSLPGEKLSCFSQSLQANAGTVPKIRPRTYPYKSFQIQPFRPYHLFVRCCIVLVIERAL